MMMKGLKYHLLDLYIIIIFRNLILLMYMKDLLEHLKRRLDLRFTWYNKN